MVTIALRFGEHFAPECGTIKAHEELIKQNGYVWYGKMGNRISAKIREQLLSAECQRILLIRSGKAERYWAHIVDIQEVQPPLTEIPEYYRGFPDKFKCWFKITEFEKADKDILNKWYVASSRNYLGEVSKHSMSPYFIITNEK